MGPVIVLGAAAGGGFGVKQAVPSRLTARILRLTRLLTPVRAQDAGRGSQVRADTSQIAAVDRRRGCEVDYIAAEVVYCCAGRRTFAAIVDDIAKAIRRPRERILADVRTVLRGLAEQRLLEL